MPSINWNKFPNRYKISDTHWYVSKIKTYSEESIEQLRNGLILLQKWFIDHSYLTGRESQFLENYLKSDQTSFFSDEKRMRLKWNIQTELFFTFQLEKEGLISKVNRPQNIKEIYSSLFSRLEEGATYVQLLRKYRKEVINDISANSRNFISIYKKLGLAWVEEGKGVTITSTGEKLMSKELDWRVVIEKQLLKWQLYNPTVPKRYKELKIFPYIFLLALILKLKDPFITKQEYALFVTKATHMKQLDEVANFLEKYRNLPILKKNKLIQKLNRGTTNRARPLYVELLDSASKEIGFFTVVGPLKQKQQNNFPCIILEDKKRAMEILEKAMNPVFIDFRNQLDWFSFYGDWEKGPTIEDAIEYYADIGEIGKAKAVVSGTKASVQNKEHLDKVIKEKDIENWFLDRLVFIEKGLTLYNSGKVNGHQYSTEIGTIDILALDSAGNYVVVEFKRDQSSDQTVGQLLRYVGWVHINLASQKKVRGIIIASEIDEKTRYALIGTQHPKRDSIFSIFKHLGLEKLAISSSDSEPN